ncbi:MAG TPA: AAA family ATPase [Bacteroidales bacterium]
MDTKLLNSHNALNIGQRKDNHFPGKIKLNPLFDDLNNPETILNQIEQLQKGLEVKKENKGLFKVKTANQWLDQAKKSPIPKMLFGELWHDSELCILFADTNLGKSILAVQIADSISKCKQIPGFKLEAMKQPVLYFDFELSAKQFEVRYSEKNEAQMIFENHYSFDDNFIRIEINQDAEIPKSQCFEKYPNQNR